MDRYNPFRKESFALRRIFGCGETSWTWRNLCKLYPGDSAVMRLPDRKPYSMYKIVGGTTFLYTSLQFKRKIPAKHHMREISNHISPQYIHVSKPKLITIHHDSRCCLFMPTQSDISKNFTYYAKDRDKVSVRFWTHKIHYVCPIDSCRLNYISRYCWIYTATSLI